MSEIKPNELKVLAELERTEEDLMQKALDAINIMPQTVNVDPENRSERYNYAKWRVSPLWQSRDRYDLLSNTYRLGYPIRKGEKDPLAVHIIVDENYGYPWATKLGSLPWEQQIGSLSDDAQLSEKGQKSANDIVEKIRKNAYNSKIERRERRLKKALATVAIGSALSAVIALSTGGFLWNRNRINNNAKEEALKEQFDKDWISRQLTTIPIIPNGKFQLATVGELPAGIPYKKVNTDAEHPQANPNEQLTSGLVRGIELPEGCYNIPAELSNNDTVSVLTQSTGDNVVALLKPEQNEIKICVNPADDDLEEKQRIAIQITPQAL